MTTSRTRTPAPPLLRGLLVTALASAALTACGGGEPAAEDQPADVSSSPTASSSTPTATPTPTPTVRPLSRFEDEPTVKVARSVARAAALSVNEGDKSLRKVRPFVTAAGSENFPRYFAEDFPQRFPGPLPFTPVGVRDLGGGKAEVPACAWVEGFTVDRESNAPTKSRLIAALKFTLVKQDGKWRVDALVGENRNCEKTAVKGRAF